MVDCHGHFVVGDMSRSRSLQFYTSLKILIGIHFFVLVYPYTSYCRETAHLADLPFCVILQVSLEDIHDSDVVKERNLLRRKRSKKISLVYFFPLYSSAFTLLLKPTPSVPPLGLPPLWT